MFQQLQGMNACLLLELFIVSWRWQKHRHVIAAPKGNKEDYLSVNKHSNDIYEEWTT